MNKTYIVSGYIEIEVCDCENKEEALNIATNQINQSDLDLEVEEVTEWALKKN